jgi:FPC/CPF motif-containing protein YcgG
MPTPQTPLFPWKHRAQHDFQALLDAHVAEADFPCVGAKAALAKGTLSVLACDRLDSAWDDLRIHDGLMHFAAAYRKDPGLFRSFAVIFDGPDDLSEQDFEAALWQRVQSISDKDVFLAELRRRSLLHRRPAPECQPSGAAFFAPDHGVQPARPVRNAARAGQI